MAENGTQAKKFQTRTGISRKTKEDREQYARDEAVRQQQRLAETVQTPLNAPEKGGTAGRGRLTAFSSASNRVRSENTGGVFGAAVSPLPKSRIDRNANAVSTASEEVNEPKQQEGSTVAPSDVDSSTKTKSTVPQDEASAKAEKKSSTRPRGTTSKAKDLVYVSSEDDVDEDARRDIEQIWISSDEDITLSRTNGKRKESSRGQHKPTLRPLRAPRDSRDEGEALSARNRVLSTVEKHEAGPDGQDVNRGTAVKDDNVVETSDKLLRSTGNVDKKSSKRKGGRLKDTIAVTETAEEYAERLRYNEDVRKLLGEIKHYQSPNQSGPAQTRSVDDFKDRRLYLLQFPPMTPMLLDPAEEVEVKQEPENETVPGAAATEKASGTVVKKEDRAEERPRKSDVLTADNMQLPSGLVGALRVHRSGKVTMDWGGADMEVRYGTEVDFLQDVVMTDAATETAWALGHVEKKMVCIPNWQKLYE